MNGFSWIIILAALVFVLLYLIGTDKNEKIAKVTSNCSPTSLVIIASNGDPVRVYDCSEAGL